MNQAVPESYKQGIQELEALIKELESSEVDIDRLEEKVARAAYLVGHCREKLKRTELSVNTIVASLNEAPSLAKNAPTEEDSIPV